MKPFIKIELDDESSSKAHKDKAIALNVAICSDVVGGAFQFLGASNVI